MPIYQFKCSNNHIFELNLKMSEYDKLNKEDIKCPTCGAKSTRYFTAIPFKLKGLGWSEEGYQITEMEMESNKSSDAFAAEVAEKQQMEEHKRSMGG